MNQTDKISVKTRLSAMLADHIFMCILLIPPIMPFQFMSMANDSNPLESVWIFWLLIFVYFNKDGFSSRSKSKRLFGLQIIDFRSGQPATTLQCYLRNLTIPLWPLEVLISTISPRRRLGDIIAGTSVKSTDKLPASSILNDIKSVRFDKQAILILPVALIYSLLLNSLINWMIEI